MSNLLKRKTALVFIFILFFSVVVQASSLDTIGVTLLRAVTTNLNGAGMKAGQAEASAPAFEVNPSAVGQPTNLFTWIVGSSPYLLPPSQASTFTNSLGVESGHANNVGMDFYGIPYGVATNVAHVNNYDADTFFYYYVQNNHSITERVVNQSFIFGNVSTNIPTPTNYLSVSDQQQIDSDYDNYASHFKTLFVSGAGNSGPVCPVATCYNGIGVAAYGGSSSFGPTLDNGRAKPDITAPAGVTSFSTPQVAGAAAVLIQAGLRGDGGGDTNSAADIRTVKAFLLNGAIKPADWTNNAPSPLDTRYGAGVLNVFNSYQQLVGGKHGYIVSTTVSAGGAHPPTGATGTVGVLSGWDFNTNSSSATTDGVNHYYFNVTNGASNAPFTVTATLAWNRQQSQSGINNLDLFLYDTANSNLVACSTSLVDNVEHIFIPCLPQGRYDLQVWKAGGLNTVSFSETYAMAWAFAAPTLSIAKSATNVALTWPIYPAGFRVEAATNLVSPVWSTNNLSSPVITNSLNSLMLNATNAQQFFRLRQPDF